VNGATGILVGLDAVAGVLSRWGIWVFALGGGADGCRWRRADVASEILALDGRRWGTATGRVGHELSNPIDGTGQRRPIEIGSRALDVLRVMLERPGDLLSRHEIMAAAWPGTVVGGNNLNVQISILRRVIDEGRMQRSCIQTVPGRGYRFVAPVTRVEASARSRRPAPRLSIVVLPFGNVGNGLEEQGNFVDGITEDLTTDLSRLESMFVISHSTGLTYRNKRVGTGRIGRELGVRYVLDGSVRRLGKKVLVTTRLIDAATDMVLWAERVDRETHDLFALQREITGRITNALGIELIAAGAPNI
jgi:TolB-like protein